MQHLRFSYSMLSYSIVDMELSIDVVNGLKLIASTSKIPDKYFVVLLKNITDTFAYSKRFEPPHGTSYFFESCGGGRGRIDHKWPHCR